MKLAEKMELEANALRLIFPQRASVNELAEYYGVKPWVVERALRELRSKGFPASFAEQPTKRTMAGLAGAEAKAGKGFDKTLRDVLEALVVMGEDADLDQACDLIKRLVMRDWGKVGGTLGGAARAAALTPERRSEIASEAAQKRWERAPRAPRYPGYKTKDGGPPTTQVIMEALIARGDMEPKVSMPQLMAATGRRRHQIEHALKALCVYGFLLKIEEHNSREPPRYKILKTHPDGSEVYHVGELDVVALLDDLRGPDTLLVTVSSRELERITGRSRSQIDRNIRHRIAAGDLELVSKDGDSHVIPRTYRIIKRD